MATSRKCVAAETAQTDNKPLPSVATACPRGPMVRRGSTVRVRQRASTVNKSPEIGDFCCLAQHHRVPPHHGRDHPEVAAPDESACKSACCAALRSTSLVGRDAAETVRPCAAARRCSTTSEDRAPGEQLPRLAKCPIQRRTYRSCVEARALGSPPQVRLVHPRSGCEQHGCREGPLASHDVPPVGSDAEESISPLRGDERHRPSARPRVCELVDCDRLHTDDQLPPRRELLHERLGQRRPY